ncbi:Methylmalonate semialdehyde dehydrogenase [acylating] [compost metagenome]
MTAQANTQNTVPTVKLLIGGQFVGSKTTQWRDVVNPATQEILACVPFTTTEEMNVAGAGALKQHFSRARPSSCWPARVLDRPFVEPLMRSTSCKPTHHHSLY